MRKHGRGTWILSSGRLTIGSPLRLDSALGGSLLGGQREGRPHRAGKVCGGLPRQRVKNSTRRSTSPSSRWRPATGGGPQRCSRRSWSVIPTAHGWMNAALAWGARWNCKGTSSRHGSPIKPSQPPTGPWPTMRRSSRESAVQPRRLRTGGEGLSVGAGTFSRQRPDGPSLLLAGKCQGSPT